MSSSRVHRFRESVRRHRISLNPVSTRSCVLPLASRITSLRVRVVGETGKRELAVARYMSARASHLCVLGSPR